MTSAMKVRLQEFDKNFAAQVAPKVPSTTPWLCDVIVDDKDYFTVEIGEGIPRIRTYGPVYITLGKLFRYYKSYSADVWEKLDKVANTTMFLYRCVLLHHYPQLLLDEAEAELRKIWNYADHYTKEGLEVCQLRVVSSGDGQMCATVGGILEGVSAWVSCGSKYLMERSVNQALIKPFADYVQTYAAYLYMERTRADLNRAAEPAANAPSTHADMVTPEICQR
jgi:hypothetical protein